MKVSATEEYGIRCLMHLARTYLENRETTMDDISRAYGITHAHVAKIIGILRRGGLVITMRGSKGGLKLARPPETISLAEAIRVLSGRPLALRPCVADIRLRDCGQKGDCGLRSVWKSLSDYLFSTLENVSIASLVQNNAR